MEITNLMIGDWVKIIHHHVPKPLIKVKKVDLEDFNDALLQIYPEITFEPIPITPEILEKNGYSYIETEDAWELIPNNGFGICKDEDDNCFYFCLGIFDAFNCYSDITYHYITKVEYVHELQHALKLCKIEKEIVL